MLIDVEQKILHDLAKSGLTSSDMNVFALDDISMRKCKLTTNQGYVIPYFNIDGSDTSYFRVKMFTDGPKYRQVSNSPNHVYFPLNFNEAFKSVNNSYVIITEGEKKAASACKAGFPTIAFSGVDSWRSKLLVIPGDAELQQGVNEDIHIKLPDDSVRRVGIVTGQFAKGFEDLCELIASHKSTVFICYDRDTPESDTGLKFQVQRAASDLGFELHKYGIPLKQIRQLCFPNIPNTQKIGLDDFLMAYSPKHLQQIIDVNLSLPGAFPKHPHTAAVVEKYLTANKLPREVLRRLAQYIIIDLDTRGVRMYSENEGQLYYFNSTTFELIPTYTSDNRVLPRFRNLLYLTYKVSSLADAGLMNWVTTLFGAEDPIVAVTPRRITAISSNAVFKYQLNNGEFLEVTADGISLKQNGMNDTLFETDQVLPLCGKAVLEKYEELKKEPLRCYWKEVLNEVRIQDKEHVGTLHALLYYLSPWLFKWNGLQLPVEFVLGEAGSGKSTLCELRLSIISGKPHLRNSPLDIKDWQSSVASAGGLHVTDNIQLSDKQLRQRLSDELCRIVTDPNPKIEMRKLFANAQNYIVPVNCVFAYTGITNPFNANDLGQRSMILQLDKSIAAIDNSITYDGSWKMRKLHDYGGRLGWIAHHMLVLEKFMRLYQEKFNASYRASYRLIHFEQCLMLMAQVFELPYEWIPTFLAEKNRDNSVKGDWVLEGLTVFCDIARLYQQAVITGTLASTPEYVKHLPMQSGMRADKLQEGYITAQAISEWMSIHEDYTANRVLNNARSLGRYLTSNRALILESCKMEITDHTIANKRLYKIFM